MFLSHNEPPMSSRLFSVSLLFVTAMSLSAVRAADEVQTKEEARKPAVSVVCHGRLRHGVIAIGGETTGTTITFHRVTWELQFSDDGSQELAARHNKASVAVTGTLRKVMGTEDAVRWIVDVEKLSPLDSRDTPDEGAKVTLRGTMRAALAVTGDIPDLSVHADDQIWRLDFGANRETLAAAESLIGQPVLLTGSVLPLPEESERKIARSPEAETHTVRVKTVEAAADKTADARFFP